MKKLLFLLIVLPFMLVSCDDDEEMPNVDFKVEISGGKNVDGIIYVLKGDITLPYYFHMFYFYLF